MYFLDNLLVSKFEITGNLGASLGGLEEMLRPTWMDDAWRQQRRQEGVPQDVQFAARVLVI